MPRLPLIVVYMFFTCHLSLLFSPLIQLCLGCDWNFWFTPYAPHHNNPNCFHLTMEACLFVTIFMGHDLTIIVVLNLLFIGLYGIDMDVIHLLVMFEHQCCVHYLDTNVICLFVLFKHKCCVSIHIVYIWKLCTWLPCLNNAWHLCVNDINPWNNRFRTYLEQTHEAYKFVMLCLESITHHGFQFGLKDFKRLLPSMVQALLSSSTNSSRI